MYFLKDYLFNFQWLFLGIILVTSFYVFIGILLSYVSKDFTALLLNYMVLMIVLVLPSIGVLLGLLPESTLEYIYWSPTEVTLRLLNASFLDSVDLVQYLKDAVYIVLVSLLMLRYGVLPYFKTYATKDLGV